MKFLLTFLITQSLFAGEVGPFDPSEIKLDGDKKVFTYMSSGQQVHVPLSNYYARVAHHKLVDSPKGKEDYLWGKIVFDVLKKEYNHNVTFAQINHEKIAVDVDLLNKIEFLSQYYFIKHDNIETADAEVLAYADFLKIDNDKAKREVLTNKISNLKQIKAKLEEKKMEVDQVIKENEGKSPDPDTRSQWQKSCFIETKGIYDAKKGIVLFNNPAPKLELCLMKKLKFTSDKADFITPYIVENTLSQDLLPRIKKELHEAEAMNEQLGSSPRSMDLKSVRQMFLADYEVLESKMTKVFKIVQDSGNVNDSRNIKEAPAAVTKETQKAEAR